MCLRAEKRIIRHFTISFPILLDDFLILLMILLNLREKYLGKQKCNKNNKSISNI